jgi:hypothetical protein
VEIIAAFVDSYRPLVLARVQALGVAPDALGASLDEGAEWLEAELTAQLERPFPEQLRGPLEIFQEAVRFPTEALEAAGVAAVERDAVAEQALPGDRYGLAPASSRELGEDAWHAHLAWGVQKAQALATPAAPRVGYFGSNLMDRSKIEGPVKAAGMELVVWRSVHEISDPPRVVFVDLAAPDADRAIRTLAEAGSRVVAFGPHVDDMAMVRARSLGAADALPRSRFFRQIPELLPTVT